MYVCMYVCMMRVRMMYYAVAVMFWYTHISIVHRICILLCIEDFNVVCTLHMYVYICMHVR